MNTSKANKAPHLINLILLVSFPSAAVVLLSPALPAISDYFSISSGYAQQIITIFVIGYALGQLIYSPFANRFGRRHAAFIGIGLYFISCVICLFGIYMHTVELIFVGRFFMALGSGAGLIITFTMVNDYYPPQKARSITGYVVLAYAVMPAVANAVGGFVTSNFSWVDCFYVYIIFGFIVLFATWQLPETLDQKNLHALKLKPILSAYGKAFRCPRLILFGAIFGLISSFIYIISSAAPFIGIDYIKLTPAMYGYLLLIPYAGQLIGALVSGNLNKRINAYPIISIGFCFTALGTILMFISFLCGWINNYSFIIPMFLMLIGLPIVYSASSVMAISGYADKATGSAVMSFVVMAVITCVVLLLNLIPSHQPIIMPILFIFILIIAILVFLYAKKKYRETN